VEDDPSDAEDIYGKTKYLGEVSARNAVTLRTSIIGRELTHFKSLLEWFMRQNHSKVPGFTRAFYSGVTTNYLAEVVGNVIQDYPKLSGLYQVTAQTISKCELLCLLRDSFNLDIEVIPDEAFFSDRSMKGDKFMEATGYISPPWSELAAQLANDPTPYQSWICSPSGSSTSRMEVHH
jgi:dTDP-4-dehydrorhamnose reductase